MRLAIERRNRFAGACPVIFEQLTSDDGAVLSVARLVGPTEDYEKCMRVVSERNGFHICLTACK